MAIAIPFANVAAHLGHDGSGLSLDFHCHSA